tara:strand:+ start:1329 stop:2279 length:951 start_codon:yes stop_codon:yes gene_type:complete
MKLGIIGCGNIAHFHLPAMVAVGFEISCISGRKNGLSTLRKFSKKFNIQNIYHDSYDLINHGEWDALLICCPIQNTIEYLKVAIKYNKPILAEKPISENFNDLKSFIKYNNIRVAFNRRFYENMAHAKKFLEINKSSIIKVSIPEISDFKESSLKKLPNSSYNNSSHIFDLIIYLGGQIKWKHITKITKNKKYRSILAVGETSKKHHIQLDNSYNSSENFSINIISPPKRFELAPIEVACLYEGMDVKEASEELPIRTYRPKLKNQYIENKYPNYKPGFYNQALDFMNFCKGKKTKSASIKDTYIALKTIQSLADS